MRSTVLLLYSQTQIILSSLHSGPLPHLGHQSSQAFCPDCVKGSRNRDKTVQPYPNELTRLLGTSQLGIFSLGDPRYRAPDKNYR